MVGTDIDGLPLGPRSPRIRLAQVDRRRFHETAMNQPRSHPRARELDELSYRAEVLSLMGDSTEDDIDQALHKEARDLGLVTGDQLLWDSKLRAQRLSEIRASAASNITSAASNASITSAPALSRSPSTEASRSTTLTTPRTSHEKLDQPPGTPTTEAPVISVDQADPLSSAQPGRLAHLRSGRNLSVRDDSPNGEFQRFLNQAVDGKGKQMKKVKTPTSDRSTSGHSVFSNASRRSLASLKSSFSRMTRSNKAEPKLPIVTCSTCQVSWPAPTTTDLSCGHTQCHSCVRDLVLQAVRDKTKLPPKCCNTVIPAHALQNVLTTDEQQRLVRAVLSLKPTVEDKLYCPNINFPEHIPLRLLKVDVRKPTEASCDKCNLRICRTCKQSTHQLNEICPTDWAMLCVNFLCEEQAWRRCHRCRKINELKPSDAFVNCECKAKTCAKCNAVYDLIVGCPNMCNGEKADWQQRLAEMEARKVEEAKEAARKAAEEDTRSLQLLEATRRSQENQHLRRLRQQQLVERDRFVEYEEGQVRVLAKRHAEARQRVVTENDARERLSEQKQLLASNVMEERHVAAEMSLQETLEQEKRACDLRLRHMEAYCHNMTTAGGHSPRVVSEQDLRELGRQYHLRDDMDRLHHSKIGVLRTRQAKAMEALMERQEAAVDQEREKGESSLAALEKSHLDEEQELLNIMRERMLRLVTRWEQQEAILRKKLEKQTGKGFGKMGEIPWPRGMGIDGRAASTASSKIWF